MLIYRCCRNLPLPFTSVSAQINIRTEQRSGAWKMNTQVIRAQQSIAVHVQVQESEVQNIRPNSLAM